MEDLEEAITSYREVLTLCPLGHANHSITLINLASATFRRYEQLGGMADLEEAITYSRKALNLTLLAV